MTPMVAVVMFSWIPFSLWLFTRLKPRHAVIAVFALGWMFLPQHTYNLPSIPDYSRITAIAYGILAGTWIFNRQAFSAFTPSLVDLPMLVWCVVPFFTSLSNDLGAWDGISAMQNRMAMWGLPYYIGRIYFNDRQALTELAFGIFLAGLVYVPFCLYEVIMSPRLHKTIYGWHAHEFGQSIRGGGYRPVVFMEHGLMVAMWIVMAFLSGYQLLRSGWLNSNFPKYGKYWKYLVALLFATMILNKSAGAIVLAIVAILFLKLIISSRSILPMLLLLSLPVLYTVLRGGGYWDGQNLLTAAGTVTSQDRVGSLYFRMRNEDMLVDKAKQRVWLGWGLHQRAFVFNDEGKAISIPDGMWVLAFGEYGATGLTALGSILILPSLLFLHCYPPRRWVEPSVGAIVAQPFIIATFTIDSLFNAMFNPLVLILAGGISTMWLNRKTSLQGEDSAEGAATTHPGNLSPPCPTRLF